MKRKVTRLAVRKDVVALGGWPSPSIPTMRKSKEERIPQMRKKTHEESIHSLAFSFLLPVTVLLFALCLSAEAQQPTKVARIGYLNPGDPVNRTYRTEAFRQGLKQLGYVEGKNIIIEYRFAEARERLPELARELV